MDEIRTEWLMSLPRIPVFLTALEINLPNGSFLKNFLYTKHHNLLFAGVYCDEKRFISKTVILMVFCRGITELPLKISFFLIVPILSL